MDVFIELASVHQVATEVVELLELPTLLVPFLLGRAKKGGRPSGKRLGNAYFPFTQQSL